MEQRYNLSFFLAKCRFAHSDYVSELNQLPTYISEFGLQILITLTYDSIRFYWLSYNHTTSTYSTYKYPSNLFSHLLLSTIISSDLLSNILANKIIVIMSLIELNCSMEIYCSSHLFQFSMLSALQKYFWFHMCLTFM